MAKRIKRDDRSFHGRPKRDRGKNHTSVGTSKRNILQGKGVRK